jgi:hypothetical protein
MTDTHTPRSAAPLAGGGPIRLSRGIVVPVHGRYVYLPNTAASPFYRSIGSSGSDLTSKVRQ